MPDPVQFRVQVLSKMSTKISCPVEADLEIKTYISAHFWTRIEPDFFLLVDTLPRFVWIEVVIENWKFLDYFYTIFVDYNGSGP